jgi:hypothetical protein
MIICSTTVAQEKKFSGWAMSANTIKINPNIVFQFDMQLRSTNNFKNPEVFIIRPVLAYMINKTTSIGIGVGSISTWKTIEEVRDETKEFRIFQQMNTEKKYGASTIQHRIRVEERWLPEVSVADGAFKKTGTNFNFRARYLTKFMIPTKKTLQFSKGFYVVAQNEFYFNLAGASFANNKFFDQSRTYGGAGLRINKTLDIELGYMYQYVEGEAKTYISNSILHFATFLRL